jgi:hypothetical protein
MSRSSRRAAQFNFWAFGASSQPKFGVFGCLPGLRLAVSQLTIFPCYDFFYKGGRQRSATIIQIPTSDNSIEIAMLSNVL